MRTYSKGLDFNNRLKLAIIIIAIGSVMMWLTSCKDDPEPKDPAEGNWIFTNDEIDLQFTLTSYPYEVTGADIKLDGKVIIDTEYEVTATVINEIQDILFRCEGGIVRVQECHVNSDGVMQCDILRAAGPMIDFENKEVTNITLTKN